MTILKVIFSYVMAIFAVSYFASFINLLFTPLMVIGKKYKFAPPFITFIFSSLSIYIALSLFVWFCEFIDIQPTYLMFLLPYLLLIRNDFERIDKTKNGKTKTEQMLNNINEKYNYSLQIKMEYGYLIGDIAGITVFLLSINKLSLF